MTLIAVMSLMLPGGTAGQDVPAALATLAGSARLDGQISAWCRGEFRPGYAGAYAVAVGPAGGGGRYVALDSDGKVTELARYAGKPELDCHTRGAAEKLALTLRQSQTIHGDLVPRWGTTVVCGFIDDTTARCWQFSVADRTFIQVGEWFT